MHIDDITDAVEVNIPYVFNNHGAGYCAMRIAEKKLEKSILLHLQIDGLPGAPHLTGCRIHLEIGDPQPRGFLGAPPEQSTYARGKLGESKWFDQIVIGACIEPGYFIVYRAFRRKHENR